MIYLAWSATEAAMPGPTNGPWRGAFRLDRQLLLIDSESTRSRVYHALKDLLPKGTALLVAPLHEDPKFKGLASGASAWLRERDLR